MQLSLPSGASRPRRRRSVQVTLLLTALLLAGLLLIGYSVAVLVRAVPMPTDAGVVPVGTPSGNPPVGGRSAADHLPPLELSIPRLRVHAAVEPVDSVAGVLQVPADPAAVGWWSAGAGPGAPDGTVVIDGHIDSAARGPGALFHLADLEIGDPVSLRTSAGGVIDYTVRARRVYPKTGGLPSEIFAQRTASRLVLISCGGPFDLVQRSYLDNVVVYATPGRAASGP